MNNLKRTIQPIPNLLFAFPYGSQNYGTFREGSDLDFVNVFSNEPEKDQIKTNSGKWKCDYNQYSLDKFMKMVEDHDICALECLFLDKRLWLIEDLENPIKFTLDKSKLRKSISNVSNNSWVKCKKKLTLEDDKELVGKKSLYHSFRIINFGIQIATHGKIINYEEYGRDYLDEILDCPNDWEYINTKFKKRHNELMSEFRKLAPKELTR
jgi:predicted nucleotidyltransferase